MKKIMAAAITLLVILLVLAGCSNNKTSNDPTTTPSDTEETTTRGSYMILWDQVDSAKELQQIYWGGTPITKDTKGMTYNKSTHKIPGKNGEYVEFARVTWLENEDKVYYNPRYAKDGTLIYLDEYGYICTLDKETGYRIVANMYPEGEYEVILSSPEVTVFWSEEEATLIEKVSNEINKKVELPAGSEYKGYSYWAGFIFQHEDKVYSVLAYQEEKEITLVAEGVKTVIATDQVLTSDAWSNPLFLMEDGTLKGYITWDVELFEFDGAHGGIYHPYK